MESSRLGFSLWAHNITTTTTTTLAKNNKQTSKLFETLRLLGHLEEVSLELGEEMFLLSISPSNFY